MRQNPFLSMIIAIAMQNKDQLKIIKYNHLIANLMIFITVIR